MSEFESPNQFWSLNVCTWERTKPKPSDDWYCWNHNFFKDILRTKGYTSPLHLVVGKSGMTSDVTLSELNSMWVIYFQHCSARRLIFVSCLTIGTSTTIAISFLSVCDNWFILSHLFVQLTKPVIYMAAILLYDYCLTVGAEVKRCWVARLSWGLGFFYLNRYLVLFGHVPIMLEFFWLSSYQNKTKVTIMLEVLVRAEKTLTRSLSDVSIH